MKQEDQIYRGYRKRMVVTAVISSVCYGLMAGGGAAFLTAFLCWLLGFHGVWAAVGVGLGAAVLCGGSLYFFKFRPERYDVLRTIDRMGLEERTVTSAELEGDMSPMAQLQRSDARSCLERVTGEQVKATFRPYTLRKPATVALACCLVFAVGMTTVNGLASAGILPSPDLVAGAEEAQFVAVTYLVEEGGEIVAADGSGPEAMVTDQILSPGEDAEPVVAVAEEGWAFVRWSDGNKLPERQDRNVVSDLTVTAIFEEIGEGEDDDFDGALDDDKDGDYDENAPDATENGGSGSDGDAGDGGEGDGSGSQEEGSGSGDGGQEGEGNGQGQGDGAGGGWSDSNQIIDGNTDYKDVYDIYYEMAMEIIESGGELPPELADFIEGYLGGL